jgi:nicotinate phosphoribosyltransferase
MRFKIAPIGTVAHEWFMGVAAITGDYETATTTALSYWVGCFGEGVLGIALTDTFGTPAFLKAFKEPLPNTGSTEPEVKPGDEVSAGNIQRTFAQVFNGVRQDSGDPAEFVKLMGDFYRSQNIPTNTKTIVFSDSLNIDLCIEYKRISDQSGFNCTFGVGTFLTNDFVKKTTGQKSTPLNIVIKISSAEGRYAVKISDNVGKNTGDKETVEKVKKQLGYTEKEWEGGDEGKRWGKEEEGRK